LQPTYHPQISEGTKKILENKRKGDVVDALCNDANRRKVEGKKMRMPRKKDEELNEANRSQSASQAKRAERKVQVAL